MSEVRPAALQKQGDGSPQQWENCGAAAAADAALRARKNVKPATSYPWLTTSLPTMSSAIRKWCNAHFDTTVVHGLYSRWTNAAVKAMYLVTLGHAWAVSWATFVSYILAHRGAQVAIMYSYILGTKYAGSATFTGRHWIYVNERRWNATLSRYEYLVYDPLCDGRRTSIPKGPQWMNAALLRKAMEAATVEFNYTPATA